MNNDLFDTFFQGDALTFLYKSIDLALEEDDRDLTSEAVFRSDEQMQSEIRLKEPACIAGLPLSATIFSRVDQPHKTTHIHHLITDGTTLGTGETIAVFQGPARSILRAERILLNYLSHLSGIASLTQSFVQKTESTKTQIVDTRKTLPGLRYLEKYAVQVGGGRNHRMNLSQLLMLKDNHIDRAGGITRAVHCLRDSYSPCPPIEVECRSEKDVREAVVCGVDHIMFDNMSCEEIKASLKFVPQSISTEISGGVTLDNLEKLAHLGADYISVGCLTHSAKAVDMSMTICDKKIPTV